MKKGFTKICSRGAGKRIPVLFLLAWAAGSGLQAQEAESPWVGEALPAESGEYYLYNKAGGGFLLGANNWGTQSSVGEPGLLCTVAVQDGKYTITTGATNGGGLGTDGYVDNKTKAEFDFTDPTEDDTYEYVIANGENILYWGGSGTALTLNNAGSTSEAQWLLVSRGQRVASLDKASADNGVAATFYIVGANFDRGVRLDWKETHDGGNVVLSSPNKNFRNYCAEASDNNTFDIYQELTDVKNGRYVLSCQGFYRGDDTGARNAVLYAGANETPLQSADDGNGVPANADDAANAFNAGRYAGNEVSVIVTDETLRFGVRKNLRIEGDYTAFDNFRLTYYGEVSEDDMLADALSQLQEVQTAFTELGATAIAGELQAVYDQYSGSTSYAEATAAVTAAIEQANGVRAITGMLSSSLATAEAFKAEVEDGVYTLSEAARTVLNGAITEASPVLAESKMADISSKATAEIERLNSAVEAGKAYAGMIYPLTVAQALADEIGGLSDTEAYQKVEADMGAATLTYDEMVADVNALNLECRNAMTAYFLSQASAENPIDLTSFITNPNIYNDGETTEMPSGWIMAAQGSRDNTEPATASFGDAALHCGSWSGNADNSIGNAHYYTETGGTGENAVSLPDGKYLLKAATYITRQPECVSLYASTDNKDMVMAKFNGDKAAYDAAAGMKDGTTTELEITVSGGKLYIGVKGTAVVGGNGQSWQADNFRLYYIGGTPTAPLTLNITEAGYATYYAPNAFEVPAGVEAGVVSAVAEDKNQLTIDWRYPAGETVPGLTGVILKGEAKNYSAAASVANVIRPADNYLQGTLTETTVAEEGYTYYKLADGAEGLGFYYAAEDGKSITNGANKAYLALPEEVAAGVNFLLWDLEATGIGSTLADADATVDVYTLSGVCVRSQVKMSQALQGLQKGIYIVNGKKLLIK